MSRDVQLQLLAVDIPPATRRSWLALPFRDSRPCSVCGAADVTTAGRRRTAQRCLACFFARSRGVR